MKDVPLPGDATSPGNFAWDGNKYRTIVYANRVTQAIAWIIGGVVCNLATDRFIENDVLSFIVAMSLAWLIIIMSWISGYIRREIDEMAHNL